ncbi:MAG TPA: sulfotransferase [Arenimonas sp.]|nr:sulfotransferase [Arenimonas sp.]
MNAQVVPTADLAVALEHARRLLDEGELVDAEAQAREILAVLPRNPEARAVLIVTAHERGDFASALQGARSLCDELPGWAGGWAALGLLAGAGLKTNEAIASLRKSLECEPRQPRIWLRLARHLSEQGESLASAEARKRHLECANHDPRLLRAGAALSAGHLPEAERLLRQHLRQLPEDPAAMRMLAELALRLGRNEDAETLLQGCLELVPEFTQARQHLALAHYRANRPEAALRELETLLAARSDDPAARNLKAVVLCRVGEYAQAIELYRALVQQFPENAKGWLSYGHTLKTYGAQSESIAAYRRALALEPGFGEAWWSLANLKTFRFSDEDVATMRRQLRRADLDAEQRPQFEFALGKAYEDSGEYADSFAHYASGNALRRAQQPYRAHDTTLRVERAEAVLTPEFFAARRGWGCPDRDPIFIVGLPRAGSTLLEQILSSHPEVEGTMELPELISMTRELRQLAQAGEAGHYYDALPSLAAAQLRGLGGQYLERTRIQRKSGAPLFIDKMPNNFFHVGLIHLMLPNARVIDARRHPLACCFSGFKQYFARGQAFSYDLADLGAYYRDYVRLMSHYDRVLPGRVHRVFYERMVDDTEGEVRRLLEYCGLPFAPECLRFFENARPVRTASSEQVRQPIYRDGVEHWRHFEPWLLPLKAALGEVLEHYPQSPILAAAR